jgi:hypothetical protein
LEDAMTEEEALSLKEGDIVECRTSAGWQALAVDVVGQLPRSRAVRVYARRPGLTRAGRLFPAFCRRVTDLRRPADFDPFPANVYADFLDDRGQHEAARMLREAFPLGPPAELP